MLWIKRAHQCTIFRLLGTLIKVHPIPYVILETTRSGFIQVFCTFLAETLYDFYKRSPPQCKISDFWLLRWNFTKFDRLLLLKVSKVSAKKSMEKICLMIPKSGAKFEEKLFFISKIIRIWFILIRGLKIYETCTLIGPFCAKYTASELKKY